MKVQCTIPCLALFLLAGGVRADGRDAAGWAAIDARPTPQWWCDAKFGIFVHWGIYSVPAYAPVESEDGFERLAEWYQGHLQSGRKAFVDYHRQTYGAAPYASFAAQFTASPVRDTVVVNDRWGTDCRGRHGGHYTTEYGSEQEKDSKGAGRHPWEECRGIGKSFGYNRFETDADYLSAEQCVELLVSTVSRGGNLLLNVGPDSRGRIPPPMRDRLLAIGRWLSVRASTDWSIGLKSSECDIIIGKV